MISYVDAAQTGSNVNTTSVTTSLPSYTTNDLLVWEYYNGVYATLSPDPTTYGWTLLEDNGDGSGGSSERETVWYRVADGTETAPSGTQSGSIRWACCIRSYRGVDTTSPIISSGNADITTPNSQIDLGPVVNGADSNAWVVGGAAARGLASADPSWSSTINGSAAVERSSYDQAGSTNTGRSVTTAYDSNGAIGNTSDVTAQSIISASTTNGVGWIALLRPASAGTTPVSKSFSTSWAINVITSKTFSTSWNINAKVAKSLNSTWSVLSPVGAKTLTTSWNILTKISRNFITSWNIQSPPPVGVSKSFSTTWNINVEVQKVLSTTWNITARLPVTFTTQWNVFNKVSKAYSNSWSILSGVSKVFSSSWGVVGNVQVTFISSWRVINLWRRVQGASNGWEPEPPVSASSWTSVPNGVGGWKNEG